MSCREGYAVGPASSILAGIRPRSDHGSGRRYHVFWHDWIEIIFGVDPDQGNGSAEWLVVVILLIVTSLLVLGARLEWRRAWLAER